MVADTQLDMLEAKGLIRLATLQPELEYLFRHALVQDAAYESLLKQERRGLHHTVAEALEALYPERRGELASVLALHLEQAGDNERAIPYLIDAANYAQDRNAIVEAYELYGRAQSLLTPEAADEPAELRRQRVEIQLGRIKAGFSFLNDEDQLALMTPLVRQAETLGDLRLEADVHATVAFIRQFRGDRPETSPLVRHSIERVIEIARELDDPFIAAVPNALTGLSQVFSGDLVKGTQSLRDVVPLLAGKRAFVLSSFAQMALAIGLARLGRFAEADDAATKALKLAEDGDLIAKLDSMIALSMVKSLRGDLDGAVPIATKCTALSEETGATACVVASNFVLGDTYMRQGKYQNAQIAFDRSNEVSEAFNEQSFRPSLLAYMRSNAASLGEGARDDEAFEEALRIANSSSDRFSEANIVWKRADVESKHADGNRERMFADFATAAGAFADMQAKPFLARTLRDWGGALIAAGRSDEATEKLREAVTLFDEMGIQREADEVRALLAT